MPDGSACVDDLQSLLTAATSGMPTTGADASTTINAGSILASLNPVPGQTFSQWVQANSTLLLVGFGAVGAVVALTRIGK